MIIAIPPPLSHSLDRLEDDSAKLRSSGYTAIKQHLNEVAAELLELPGQRVPAVD